MDIKKMRYNRGLIARKIHLQNELGIVIQEIKEIQESCDHVIISLGYYGTPETKITECFFCGDKVVREVNYPYIDAMEFKREMYHDGACSQDRQSRLNEVQEIWIECVENNPGISREEIIAKVQAEINKEAKNKVMEKTLEQQKS